MNLFCFDKSPACEVGGGGGVAKSTKTNFFERGGGGGGWQRYQIFLRLGSGLGWEGGMNFFCFHKNPACEVGGG